MSAEGTLDMFTLRRRAELLDAIAQLMRRAPELWGHGAAAAGTADGPVAMPAGRTQLLPQVFVEDRSVVCNGASLDLASRPLMYRLFRALCSAPDLTIGREQLAEQVYLIKDAATRTERFMTSVYANGIKLVSRARILASTHLGPVVGQGVEWLVHDQDRKRWCLYRLRTGYLVEQLSG